MTVLSFNRWATWFPLAMLPQFTTATWFDLIDYMTSNLFLPLAGFGLSVFVGWAVPAALLREQLALSGRAARALHSLLRYVVPFGIAAATLVPLM